MKKVVLLCTLGMSTSLLVSKMRKAAKELGIDCSKKVDSNIPITLINSADYGTMNGNRILNQALALMDNKELSTNNL